MGLNFAMMNATILSLTVVLFLFLTTSVDSQSAIIGNHFDPGTEIRFYPPFQNFSNTCVSEKVQIEPSGRFTIPVGHNVPTMAKILIGGRSLSIFLDMGDTIYLDIRTPDFKKDPSGIVVKGTNAEGIRYFNLEYDHPPYKKFKPINTVFSKNRDLPADTLEALLKKELENQTLWLDSLLDQKKIDENFFKYIKTEIQATLIWGVLKSCKENYGGVSSGLALKLKGAVIKNGILADFPFEDKVLRRCLVAPGYMASKYRSTYKADPVPMDTSVIILYDEFRHLYSAPFDVRKYVIGSYLLGFREIVPTMYDYCSLFRKFISVYGEGEIIDSVRVSGVCKEADRDFEIVSVNETDFLEMIHNHFKGKRLYIDFWATWCVPCKMEFKNYDDELFSFLEGYNVQNVFISIDGNERHEIWEKEVSMLGLGGYHIRASPSLYTSIKKLIFNKGDVSIPRYIIVDENGDIISFNASRPTSVRSEISRIFEK